MAKGYYKKIKGKNFDRALLDLAESMVAGQGDGRISKNDASVLIKAVTDGNKYTDIEKRTIKYIRDNYKFTKEADNWFRTEIRSWAAGKTQRKDDVNKSVVKKKTKKSIRKTSPEVAPVPVIERNEPQESARQEDALPYLMKKEKKLPLFKIIAVGAVIVVLIIIGIIVIPKLGKSSGNKKNDSENIKSKTTQKNDRAESKKNILSGSSGKMIEYIVKKNDQLTEISKKHLGDYAGWKNIYKANRQKIKNPNLIFPGQKLYIPRRK